MVKTLTIREEVYNKLVKMKRKDESFSELFTEMIEGRSFKGKDLREFMGMIDEKEYKRMKKETATIRKKMSGDFEKRQKRWGLS